MTLTLCRQFFDYLNDSHIGYCHWKSNLHLTKALEGKTDLDILVPENSRRKFEETLVRFSFKKMLSPPSKRFPGVEDYLGFDTETGGFIHLHLHYDLVLGQKFIKNHTLPIGNVFFNHLCLKDNVYIPCPELELLILIIRAHMKCDLMEMAKLVVKNLIANMQSPFPAQIDEELTDLITRYKSPKFKQVIQECNLGLGEKQLTDFIVKFPGRRLTALDYWRLKRAIHKALRKHQRRSNAILQMKYMIRLVLDYTIFKRFRRERKKTLPGQGKMVALVGADGSGKSTLIKEIEKWLSWKLSVGTSYMGIPKSVSIRVFSKSLWYLQKMGFQGLVRQLYKVLWVLVAFSRLKSYKKSLRGKSRGWIILTDRFPLIEFHKMDIPMDGPRLNRQDGIFSRIERSVYSKIGLPDKVLVLKADMSVLRTRKADLPIETHQSKVDAINALCAGDALAVIDANQPFPSVQLEARRIIWDVL